MAIDDSVNELWVSDVTLLEVALKHSAGKLPLPGAPRTWIPEKIAYHHFIPLGLRPVDIYRCGELPRVHGDPFDRLLAAQVISSCPGMNSRA